MNDTPHLFDPDTHNEPLGGLWDDPVRFGPSTVIGAVRCVVCSEPIRLGRRAVDWVHVHSGEAECGTGDGSVAYPFQAYECMNCGVVRTPNGWLSCEDVLGARCRPIEATS